MSLLTKFVNQCLENATYPEKPTYWHVQGILKNKSNQIFKFDVRGMQKQQENRLEKKGNINSNAEKMVFETGLEWIILDNEELNNYVIKHNLKDILFEDLLENLEWIIRFKK